MNELLTKREEAYIVHNRIITNGRILQSALVEVCKDLKEMRDKKLFEEIGYSSFEDYAEQACGIKQRQAYSYISAYEKLGSEYLNDNAALGITKLELISQISSYEREDFLEKVNPEEVSTRELKQEVENYKKQTEQLTLDLEKPDNDKAELVEKNKELESELKKEKGNKEIVIQPEKASDNSEIKKEYEQQIKELKKEKSEAVKQAKESVTKKFNEMLEKISNEKAESEKKLQEALKKAKVNNADEITLAVRFLFNDLQSTANEIKDRISKIEQTDSATAEKLRAAIKSVLSDISNNI